MMKADELREHLSRNPVDRGVFSYSELDEVILSVYNIIDWLVRDKCDVIEVRNKQVVWYKGDKVYNQISTPFNFKPAFEKIRSRDKIIQTHLKLMTETNDRTLYKVVALLP